MYDIEANKANTGLYGINKGFAQVFDNSGIENVALHKQALQQAEQKQKEAKLTGLMSDISKIGKGEIRPADIKYFGDKQKAVYDATKKAFTDAKGGDLSIDQQIALEGQIADIQREATISGARHKQNMQEYQKAVLNPDLYDDPEEIAKIQADSFDTANGGKFNTPLQTLTKRYDITKGINSEVAPLFAQNNPAVENSNPIGGNQVSVTKNVRTPELANKTVFEWAKTNPEALRQAHKEISRNSGLGTKYNHDNDSDYLAKYIADQYSNPLVNESIVKNDTRPLPKETEFEYKKRMGLLNLGDDDKDIIDTAPSSYKIQTTATDDIGKNSTVEGTINTIASARLGKNLTKDLTLNSDIREFNGNKLPVNTGVFPVSGSDINVVPVYKKGAIAGDGKKDLSGNLVPSERLDEAIKNGKVEYKAMFNGIMKVPDLDDNKEQKVDDKGKPIYKDISISSPASLLKGGVGKSESTIDKMQEIADKKNYELNNGKTKILTPGQEENIKTLPSGLKVKKINGVWTPI